MTPFQTPHSQRGFTLLEILLVLGIIGAVSAAVLPNIGLTASSQMRVTLRDLTQTMRATFDAAVISGRLHRLVFEPKTGTYWAEAAPVGFVGRPPVAQNADEGTFGNETRTRLIEALNHLTAEPRRMRDQEDRYYSFRSVLVMRRKVLEPVKWTEIDDSLLSKRKVAGSVALYSLKTPSMAEKLTLQKAADKETGVIYFFPSGSAEGARIQLVTRKDDGEPSETEGPRYTIKLDPLTGQSELLEGLPDDTE